MHIILLVTNSTQTMKYTLGKRRYLFWFKQSGHLHVLMLSFGTLAWVFHEQYGFLFFWQDFFLYKEVGNSSNI